MQLTKFLPVAMLAYATSVAAIPDGYGGSYSAGSGDSSSGGSALPATGGSDDSSTPATGGAASPATGDAATGDAGFEPAVNCRNNICYSAVVPSATARSGSGPIWFQIYAPTTFSWVGMGTGSGMVNANMFIIYQDGNGNVTLSHRQASGHTMPQVPADSTVQTTILPGTGVSNGFMIANFRCDNCTTWKRTNTLSFNSSGTDMIGAWSEGDSLDSTDVEESISVHTGNPRLFSFDLSTAQKSTAGNPFVGQFSVPANASGANNTDNGGDDEDAAIGRFSFLSSSVAAAALVTGLSFLL